MNHKEARQALTPIAANLNSEVAEGGLDRRDRWFSVGVKDEMAGLDGHFTPEQLEAIAYWMRHPGEFEITPPTTEYQIECGTEELAEKATEEMPGNEVYSQFGDSRKPISRVEKVVRDGTKVCVHLTEPVTEPTTIVIDDSSFALRGLKGYRDCHLPG